MHYFTPELYLRYNSEEDDVADAADAEWEAALKGYRAHLDVLAGRLTARCGSWPGSACTTRS